MESTQFTLEAKVRDYELDSLGIVNHAIYVHYLEHCRNEFARNFGINLQEIYQAGYSLVVARLEISYKSSLRAQDEFIVTAEIIAYSDKRIVFRQNILHKHTKQYAANAIIFIACVNNKTGESIIPLILKNKLSSIKYLSAEEFNTFSF